MPALAQSGDLAISVPGVDSNQERARCLLQVVTPDGRPIVGAMAATVVWAGAQPRQEGWWITDRQGAACGVGQFFTHGTITVTAPLTQGGRCAGFMEFDHWGWADFPEDTLRRITLQLTSFARKRWLARVVASDGRPIHGASIWIQNIEPKGAECSDRGPDERYETGRDGKVLLPLLPEGVITLRVKHAKYAERFFKIDTTATRQDLLLERGARWTGRLLDPNGMPIEHCRIHLDYMVDQMEIDGSCSSTGFDIQAIPAGHADVRVEITGPHPTFERRRVHKMQIDIAPNEHRVDDIRWPVGLPISGQVVAADGQPVPSANITLLSQNREMSSAQGTIDIVADANGRFIVQHLAPGGWTISCGDRSLGVYAGMTNVRLVVSRSR